MLSVVPSDSDSPESEPAADQEMLEDPPTDVLGINSSTVNLDQPPPAETPSVAIHSSDIADLNQRLDQTNPAATVNGRAPAQLTATLAEQILTSVSAQLTIIHSKLSTPPSHLPNERLLGSLPPLPWRQLSPDLDSATVSALLSTGERLHPSVASLTTRL